MGALPRARRRRLRSSRDRSSRITTDWTRACEARWRAMGVDANERATAHPQLPSSRGEFCRVTAVPSRDGGKQRGSYLGAARRVPSAPVTVMTGGPDGGIPTLMLTTVPTAAYTNEAEAAASDATTVTLKESGVAA
jgi:hypothetical protein